MKKSKNTSPRDLGPFIKIAGQYIVMDDDRGIFTTGVRYSYSKKKQILHLKIEKMNADLEKIEVMTFKIRKKDLKRLIKLFETSLMYESMNLEEEDNLD